MSRPPVGLILLSTLLVAILGYSGYGFLLILQHGREDKMGARIRSLAVLASEAKVPTGSPSEILEALRARRDPNPDRTLRYLLSAGNPAYVKVDVVGGERVYSVGALRTGFFETAPPWEDVTIEDLRNAPWFFRHGEWVRYVDHGRVVTFPRGVRPN